MNVKILFCNLYLMFSAPIFHHIKDTYIKLSFKKTEEEEENVRIKNMVKKGYKKIDINMNKCKKNYIE